MKTEKSEIVAFFRNIIGIKDKYALEQLGEHSRRWTLKAKSILLKEKIWFRKSLFCISVEE